MSSSMTSMIFEACPKLSRRQKELLCFHLSCLEEENNPRAGYIVDDLNMNISEAELITKLNCEWMQLISLNEGQSIIFCNRFKVNQRLREQQAVFIDIGRYGRDDNAANVLTENHKHRSDQIEIVQKMIESDKCIFHLNQSDYHKLDVPAIFGLLLGFPVIYCNVIDKEYSEICFDRHGVELNLTKVKDGDKDLFSFSFPIGLKLDNVVDKWIEKFVHGKRYSAQRTTVFQHQFVL